MKIGFFDSGLGGLVIVRSAIESLSEYDLVYYGDTARMPYGNRTDAEVFEFVENGVEYLYKQGCGLVILACNTASAKALRKIQTENKLVLEGKLKVLGVIVPTIERVLELERPGLVSVIATRRTVETHVYKIEMSKKKPGIEVVELAVENLASLIENGENVEAERVAEEAVGKLKLMGVKTVILGCTHYCLLKGSLRKTFSDIEFISQDEIIPLKIKEYLLAHRELNISKGGSFKVILSLVNKRYKDLIKDWFGGKVGVFEDY